MKKILLSLLVSFVGLATYSQVQVGTSTTTTGNIPFPSNWGYTYSQQLYYQSEINASGNITTVSFYYSSGTITNSDSVTIYLGHSTKTAFNSTTDWVPLASLTQVFKGNVTYPSSAGWFTITLDIPFAYNNVDNLVVAFEEDRPGFGSLAQWRYSSSPNYRSIYYRSDGTNPDPASPPTASARQLYSNNIILGGIQRSCPEPTSLTLASIFSDSARVTWTNGANDSAWIVEYGVAGFVQGMGTTITSGNDTVGISGLSSNTSYDYYLRSICTAGDTSVWVGPLNFTTTCSTPITLPYTETFDASSTTQSCWLVVNNNNDADEWDMDDTYDPYMGDEGAVIYTDGNSGNNDDYLISPKVTLNGNQRIRFYTRARSTGEPNDFEVLISATGNNPASFTTVIGSEVISSTTYLEKIYNLNAYSGDYFIAIRVPNGGLDGWRLYIDEFTIEDIPSCPKPSALTSFSIGIDTANITWTNGLNDSIWIVQYDTTGFTLGTGNNVVSQNDTLTLSGLSQDTDYDVYLKSICHVGDSSVWIGPISFTTLQSCPAPNAVSAFATSDDSTKLTWINGLYDSAWIIEYGIDGFAPGTGTIILTDTNINTIYGLMQNTDYDVYIRSICTVGDTSLLVGPYSFTTLCGSQPLPYLENFSSYLPDCWEEANGRLSATTSLNYGFSDWQADGFGNVGFSGSARMEIWTTNKDEWLISPTFDLGNGSTTYQVDFDLALTYFSNTTADVFGADDTLALVISTDNGLTWSSSNIIYTWKAGDEPSPTGDFEVFSLSGYTGKIKLAFYAASSVSNEDVNVYVDNFRVREVPACLEPRNLASYYVGSDSVSLTWTAGPSDSSWLVEYGPTGFVLGTGITLSSNNDSLVVTGLAGATTYDFYVRGICTGGDTSIYVGAITETTNCPLNFVPAYSQDFSTYVPDCWSEAAGILTDSTTFTSTTSSVWTSDGFGNVGTTGSARIMMNSSTRKDWLISPSFDLGNGSTTYQLEFDVALTAAFSTTSNVLDPGDTLALLVSTDNGITWSDTNIMRVWDENTSISNTGDRVKIRLTNYTDTVKFAFYAQSNISGVSSNFYVDNFDVIVAPTCPEGDSLMALNYGFDTVALSWNAGLFDSTWIIEYDTVGFTLGTGNTHLASTNPTTVTGLIAVSTYDFYLRSVCTAGDSSIWIGPLTITTKAECPAPTTISDFLLARDSNNITWVGDLSDSLYFIEWDSTGFTIGTGNMVTQAEDTIVLNGLGANTTYDFYVRTLCKSNDTSEWVGPFTFTTIESCPVVSSISEFNTTKDSTNVTWISGQYDSVWLIEYDTIGFTLGTGNMITSTNDTISVNGLNPDTDYQFYVRSICTAGDTSVLVGPFTVTTLESCPSVDSLFSFGVLLNSASVSWKNGFYDSSWIIEYDVTGFAPGTGNIMSSSNDTVNLTGLTDATMYDVYVRSICTVGDTSQLVGPLTFATNIANPSACGLNFDIPDNTCGTTGNEYTITVTSAIGTQLGTDVVLKEVRTIITHTWAGDIELRLVSPAGDTVELSTDNGSLSDNYGDTTGGCTQYTAFNMEAFTNITSGSAPFIGSYIPEGDLNDFNNNSSPIGDWKLLLCDDASGDIGALQFIELVFDLPITCPRPSGIQAYDPGKDSVVVSWTAGANDSVWAIEYGPTGFALGTGTIVGASNDTTVVYGLSSDVEYDFYVRGVCHAGDSSIWIGPATETTLPACIRTQSFTVLSSDSSSINVGWNIDPSHTSYIVEYGAVGFTPGTGTSSVVNYPNNFLTVNGLTPLTEYEFYVKAVCTSGDTSIWDGPYVGKTTCSSFATLPFLETFTTYVPECWHEAKGALSAVPTTFTDTTTSNWKGDGFANVGTTGAASLNVYTSIFSGSPMFEWLISPTINLGSGAWQTHKIEFDIAFTDYGNSNAPTNGFGPDDRVALLISTDNGATWVDSNILVLFDTANTPSHTGDHITYILKNHSGLVKFAFYGESSVSNEDNDVHIDNFQITDTVFVGIDELNTLSQFKVYPNPNNGEFTLYNEGNSLKTVVTVMDIQGRVVYDENLTFSQNARKRINLTGVKTGMYILQITSEGRSQQLRLVIE